ncbi:hypothetical protein TNCV_3254781 [Trichonephila clavipes]|nr:hypothetical protein TNCV_3254781 [Trichonephila clavipes]
MKSWYRFASSELRFILLGWKLSVKTIFGDWNPPIWCRTKKRYQLSRNGLSMQWLATPVVDKSASGGIEKHNRGVAVVDIIIHTGSAPSVMSDVKACNCDLRRGFRNLIFVQDNARLHVAYHVLIYRGPEGVLQLHCPGIFPDLSPIEGIWSWVGTNTGPPPLSSV